MSSMIESPTAVTGPAIGTGPVGVVLVEDPVVLVDPIEPVDPVDPVDPVGGTLVGGETAGLGSDDPTAKLAPGVTATGGTACPSVERWARPKPRRASKSASSPIPMIRSIRLMLPIRSSVPCQGRDRAPLPAALPVGARLGHAAGLTRMSSLVTHRARAAPE